MNLIEELGGYENAKRELELKEQNSVFQCCTAVDAEMIRSALLQRRRENNIFEVGDLFVFNNGDNPEITKVQHVWGDAVWGGYCGEIPKNTDIRHATPQEIKAGHRL